MNSLASGGVGGAEAVDRQSTIATAPLPISTGHRRRNTVLSSATFPRHAAQAQRRPSASMAGTAASSSNGTLSTTHDQSSRHNFDRSAEQTVSNASGANALSLKLSVSMISLQPPNAAQTPEAGMPSMRQERPYNSLKKKRNSDRELWRQSWGSAHSHSSCSIHSNAAASNNVLSQTGKDDFWAALQTNYNYIMDTNLLDTCKEARFELSNGPETSGTVATSNATSKTENNVRSDDDAEGCADCAKLNNVPGRPIAPINDARQLRRWLRKMEIDIAAAPTLFQAKRMKIAELRRRLREHSELYRQIVSQTSEVRACIRTAGSTTSAAAAAAAPGGVVVVVGDLTASSISTLPPPLLSQPPPPPPPSSSSCVDNVSPPRKSDASSLKGLETRYHMLYLQAIEVQCLLEGLLARKEKEAEEEDSSSASSIPPDTDEEPLAKFPRLTEETVTKPSVDSVDCAISKWLPFGLPREVSTNNGFDADSEGSDNETTSTPTKQAAASSSTATPPHMLAHSDRIASNNNSNKRHEHVAGPMGIAADATVAIAADVPDFNGNPSGYRASIDTSSSLSVPKVLSTPVSPPQQTATKRSRMPDASKFNRSNRKSKNCATFYFKHSDTDGETRGWSTHASESMNATSEEDEWVYKNDPAAAQNAAGGDSSEENTKTSSANANTDTIMDPLFELQKHLSATTITAEPETNGNYGCPEMSPLMTTSTTSTVIDLGQMNCSSDDAAKNYQKKKSIQQLVQNAETLLRDDQMVHKQTRKYSTTSDNPKAMAQANIQTALPKSTLVHDWIAKQSMVGNDTLAPAASTDCEASAENTDSDSGTRDSDTSDALSDSVATCHMQETDARSSQFTSNEVLACGSSEVIGGASVGGSAAALHTTVNGPPRVVMRPKRRNSERPWSVSCLSQLKQTETTQQQRALEHAAANQGLANHSISESALHMWTMSTSAAAVAAAALATAAGGGTTSAATSVATVHQSQSSMRSVESKNSLKRRKMRAKKKLTGRKSESGSNGSDNNNCNVAQERMSRQPKSETIPGRTNMPQDLSTTSKHVSSDQESDQEQHMMVPNFRVGAYTNSYGAGASKLGSLAALANYNIEKEVKELSFTGTDNSNEQAWDPYQDRYNSEAYSEGMDSDAARRLLEFGDDYRNFLDSQSDCCSSLSAANNLDSSLSPLATRRAMHSMTPAMQQHCSDAMSSSKSPSKSPTFGGDETTVLRRRRGVPDCEFDRRRRSSESTRKSQLNEFCKTMGFDRLSSSSGKSSQQNMPSAGKPPRFGGGRTHTSSTSAINRKLEMEFINKLEKRQSHDDLVRRRLRSERTMNAGSSSSADDSSFVEHQDDVDAEMLELLQQCETRMEHTRALRVRSHLLRPEDYVEILTTCRDNIKCLESVLRGLPGTVIPVARSQGIRDILSSWESLLHWSENASVARQLQEEMAGLKGVMNKLGRGTGTCDSDSAIQLCIEELQNDKHALQTHRSAMLRLNASVHSWLTRQEMKLAKTRELRAMTMANNRIASSLAMDAQTTDAADVAAATAICSDSGTQMSADDHPPNDDEELHKQLKNEVGEMYSVWDEADARIGDRLDALTTSLIAWKQFESGLNEFTAALGKDKGALRGLNGILDGPASDGAAAATAATETTTKLALDVKEVAKRLSEHLDNNLQRKSMQQTDGGAQQQKSTGMATQPITGPDSHYLNSLLKAIPFGLSSTSNGSLSDSGISDGGASSDYGLSERERRLGALRRLARQLENALAPGSAALVSIAQRMEAAEADLRSLQDTCRQLIVRTAASQIQQQQHQQQQQQQQQELEQQQNDEEAQSSDAVDSAEAADTMPEEQHAELMNVPKKPIEPPRPSQSKRQSQRQQQQRNSGPLHTALGSASVLAGVAADTGAADRQTERQRGSKLQQKPGQSQPDDDPSGDPSGDVDKSERRRWARRVAKYALPIHMALVAIICAVVCLEPHCCDTLNNHFMSFTPQLHYVRGPPPI